MTTQDMRYSSPSALRNREHIYTVLRDVLPSTGKVLEIASGSGEHITYFAERSPSLTWQPSDPSSKARASIQAWLGHGDFPNVLPPLDIDTTQDAWPIDQADVMIAINMVHISPWTATQGLLERAGQLLSSGGMLALYGPYRQEDKPFAESNVDFDNWLKSENSAWGVRQLEDVTREAEQCGLSLASVVDMPANNLTVVYRRCE